VRVEADVLVAAGCELGEGPVWSVAEQRLYWVDILGARVHSCTANGGDRRDFGTDRHVGCVALRAGGGLLLAARDRFEWRDATGQLTRTVDLPERDPELRFNDGACDPAGRFLAGTMAYRVRRGAGTVYRLDPAARSRRCCPASASPTGSPGRPTAAPCTTWTVRCAPTTPARRHPAPSTRSTTTPTPARCPAAAPP
jgi:sugar lactone lactonase YvrE